MDRFYFDKSVLYGVNSKRWDEFWNLARQKEIRGYYSPLTYFEIASGLYKKFKQNKKCFKLIRKDNIDIFEHPEICIAKYILGSVGIPENIIREEELNYQIFRATSDFIIHYCLSKDDLNKVQVVNIQLSPLSLKTMVETFRGIESNHLFIVRKKEWPLYKVRFDFNWIKKFRKRYEEEWIGSMKEMHKKVKEYFNNLAKKLKIEKIDKSFIVKEFTNSYFAKFFLEALFERAAEFLFKAKNPLQIMNKEWKDADVYEKLGPLNAFFEAFKSLIIKELTGGIEKNDYNDLLLLVYLGKGYRLITNDQALTNKVECSSQRKQIMTFEEAFKLLKNTT